MGNSSEIGFVRSGRLQVKPLGDGSDVIEHKLNNLSGCLVVKNSDIKELGSLINRESDKIFRDNPSTYYNHS